MEEFFQFINQLPRLVRRARSRACSATNKALDSPKVKRWKKKIKIYQLLARSAQELRQQIEAEA